MKTFTETIIPKEKGRIHQASVKEKKRTSMEMTEIAIIELQFPTFVENLKRAMSPRQSALNFILCLSCRKERNGL